jgi:energy-coupling factor transporter ATP-binding protein EcfA2
VAFLTGKKCISELQILADMETYKATSNLFNYLALPPMTLKGKKRATYVYCVLSATPQANIANHIPPSEDPEHAPEDLLIGREVEYQIFINTIHTFLKQFLALSPVRAISGRTIVETLSAASEGKAKISEEFSVVQDVVDAREREFQYSSRLPDLEPETHQPNVEPCAMILLIGHAGIGKSKLLQSVISRLKKEQSPVQILLSASDPEHNNVLVFGPWARLVCDLLCFDPRSTPEERGAIVAKHLHASSMQHAHLLKDILKIKIKKPNQTTSQIQSANKGKMLKRWQSDPTQSSGNSSISKKVLCVL